MYFITTKRMLEVCFFQHTPTFIIEPKNHLPAVSIIKSCLKKFALYRKSHLKKFIFYQKVV